MSAGADTPLRVVVAEDSLLVRMGITRVLDEAGLRVVGEACDADELLRRTREHAPDVVVTDIRMPPTDTDEGLRAAAVIRAERPATGVLVLSQFVTERYALQLLSDGAAGVGYLLKQRVLEPDGFVRAVRAVAAGGSVLDPEVVTQMLERRRGVDGIEALSDRESTVLARVAEGWSNRAIARALELSDHTLERDLSSIFDKLDLPRSGEGHRRVLAVLSYLRSQGD